MEATFPEREPWQEGDDVTIEIRGPGGTLQWVVQGNEQVTITHRDTMFVITERQMTTVTLGDRDPGTDSIVEPA